MQCALLDNDNYRDHWMASMSASLKTSLQVHVSWFFRLTAQRRAPSLGRARWQLFALFYLRFLPQPATETTRGAKSQSVELAATTGLWHAVPHCLLGQR